MDLLQVYKQAHSRKSQAWLHWEALPHSNCYSVNFLRQLLLVQVPNAMMAITLLLIQLQAEAGLQALPGKVHLKRQSEAVYTGRRPNRSLWVAAAPDPDDCCCFYCAHCKSTRDRLLLTSLA